MTESASEPCVVASAFATWRERVCIFRLWASSEVKVTSEGGKMKNKTRR